MALYFDVVGQKLPNFSDDFQKTLQNNVITVFFKTKTLFRDLVMYSHETFMNFVFPPHLVTVIKARVRIQAARLPLYKEDHMKTG